MSTPPFKPIDPEYTSSYEGYHIDTTQPGAQRIISDGEIRVTKVFKEVVSEAPSPTRGVLNWGKRDAHRREQLARDAVAHPPDVATSQKSFDLLTRKLEEDAPRKAKYEENKRASKKNKGPKPHIQDYLYLGFRVHIDWETRTFFVQDTRTPPHVTYQFKAEDVMQNGLRCERPDFEIAVGKFCQAFRQYKTPGPLPLLTGGAPLPTTTTKRVEKVVYEALTQRKPLFSHDTLAAHVEARKSETPESFYGYNVLINWKDSSFIIWEKDEPRPGEKPSSTPPVYRSFSLKALKTDAKHISRTTILASVKSFCILYGQIQEKATAKAEEILTERFVDQLKEQYRRMKGVSSKSSFAASITGREATYAKAGRFITVEEIEKEAKVLAKKLAPQMLEDYDKFVIHYNEKMVLMHLNKEVGFKLLLAHGYTPTQAKKLLNHASFFNGIWLEGISDEAWNAFKKDILGDKEAKGGGGGAPPAKEKKPEEEDKHKTSLESVQAALKDVEETERRRRASEKAQTSSGPDADSSLETRRGRQPPTKQPAATQLPPAAAPASPQANAAATTQTTPATTQLPSGHKQPPVAQTLPAPEAPSVAASAASAASTTPSIEAVHTAPNSWELRETTQ